MGNVLYCEKCDSDKACNESVINLSDNCVNRLTNDEKKSKPKGPKNDDDAWMMKLKCLDDIHSNNYGLTMQAIEGLFQSLELLCPKVPPPPCPHRALLFCLKSHENCMIHCKGLLDEFVDCVDTHRINKVKERMEIEKKRKKEEEEIAKKLKEEKK